ncbi:MAG TPA: acyl carrier protein [Firmicutes bacterium]|nr:acyl carrier protein [Bacillota bacterium]
MEGNLFDIIVDKLSEYLKVDKSKITMDTNIKTDLNADSLTVVELLFAMEQEYDITIPDDVVDGLETVGDLVKYLETVVK